MQQQQPQQQQQLSDACNPAQATGMDVEEANELGDDEEEEDAAVNPLVTQGLALSTAIFELSKAYLKRSIGQEHVEMLRADVKTVRKHALAINRALLQYVKIANERENRLLVEIHLLRQAAHRDGIDRDANRARIYEYLRRYRTDDERLGGGCGGGGGGGGGGGALGGVAMMPSVPLGVNPLHAPTLAAMQVDRAMSSVARIEAAIALLSPTGAVPTHGAGLLATSAAAAARPTS